MIDCETETPNQFMQKLLVREKHALHADVPVESGSDDAAPSPHDFFDAALASCKTLTATWYARHNKLPLERVESHVERDSSQEKAGTYKLTVRLALHGPLSDEEKKRIYAAVARCPIHKLMTTSEVVVETLPL